MKVIEKWTKQLNWQRIKNGWEKLEASIKKYPMGTIKDGLERYPQNVSYKANYKHPNMHNSKYEVQ